MDKILDRICQYSTIIFAGNVVVLIIVSITTDYWEFRGFDLKSIRKIDMNPKTNAQKTIIELPGKDMNNYISF